MPSDELSQVLTAWPTGSLTTIAAGSERVINFAPTIASRPRVSWAADPSAAGGELVVLIDDARVRLPMSATVSAADLPRIAPGRHRVRIDGPARGCGSIGRPVSGGAGVVRDRTLLIDSGRAASACASARRRVDPRLRDRLRGARRAAPGTSLVMTVDGRRPTRHVGVSDRLTVPEVRVPMPAAKRNVPAMLVDLGGKAAGLPRSVGIGILPDLVGGSHGVDLYRLGGEDLWVRFVTTQRVGATPEPTREWTPGPGATIEVLHD